MAGIVARLKSWVGMEGSDRGMPYGFDNGFNTGNAFQAIAEGFYQRDLALPTRSAVAAVQAAISKYTDALIAMPLGHLRELPTGGYERLKTSAFVRWSRSPTSWQLLAEWLSEGNRSLLETGNAVAYLVRNDRNEVIETPWATNWSVHVDQESGAIFYALQMPKQSGAWDDSRLIPARDVLHLRVNVDGRRDPLRGRSPLQWCASALATSSTLSAFLVSYLNNRASPSYALTTDMTLNAAQMAQLRAAWDEQSRMINSGRTPILGNGLKPVTLGAAPGDALLVETFNLTVEDIARAFSLPKSFLGIDETASNSANLIREWMALGLGSHVELWEQALERVFRLSSDEHIEFDATVLLRLDPQAEASRLKELVTGSILSADEARAVLSLPPVEQGFGTVPMAQQQMIPLNLLAELHAATIDSKTAPPPAPPPAAEPAPPPAPPEPVKEFDMGLANTLLENIRLKAHHA